MSVRAGQGPVSPEHTEPTWGAGLCAVPSPNAHLWGWYSCGLSFWVRFRGSGMP